ncbi:MAG: PqiC family protein [Thermoanaerobaculia bacterium]
MRTVAITLALSLFLAGCSIFSRSPSRLFSLEPIPGAVRDVRGAAIAIDSVELPPSFDRREIVVRRANHQLEVRGTELWSAPLARLVLHTLAFDLAGRLPEGMVILPGAVKPAVPVRSIDLAFEVLAAGPDPKVIIDARWTMSGATRHEHIEVAISSLDSANIASGMTEALASLADRIVAGL